MIKRITRVTDRLEKDISSLRKENIELSKRLYALENPPKFKKGDRVLRKKHTKDTMFNTIKLPEVKGMIIISKVINFSGEYRWVYSVVLENGEEIYNINEKLYKKLAD